MKTPLNQNQQKQHASHSDSAKSVYYIV